MLRDKKRLAMMAILLMALVGVVIFSMRSASPTARTPTPRTPTLSVSNVQTEAVAAFASGLTSTAQAVPSRIPTSTDLFPSPPDTTGTISATPSCYKLRFVNDVTIPDNTAETPAQVFTKTWLVENDGTCAWQAGFKVVLIGGVAMGGSPFTLLQSVSPGGRIQISIKMAAPTDQNGIVQGTWRMSDDTGVQFGDSMWVTIVVGNETSTPPTAIATATP